MSFVAIKQTNNKRQDSTESARIARSDSFEFLEPAHSVTAEPLVILDDAGIDDIDEPQNTPVSPTAPPLEITEEIPNTESNTTFSGEVFPTIDKSKHSWQKLHNLIEKHDNDMCKAWTDEIQNLLLFTGLFTAAVTAFVVESYQWLHNTEEDETVKLLAQVVLHLTSINNLTNTPPPPTGQTQSIPGYMIRVNVFWFLSLTISLSTVLLGILCLQWLREFQRDAVTD